MQKNYYPFVNTPLPYAYDALEPYIDAKTMYLHHDRHLQTYIDNLNEILEQNPQLQALSLEQLIVNASRLPYSLQAPIRNNAGGVYNHRLFFAGLTNPSTGIPRGRLNAAITGQFGSFGSFARQFTEAALSVFGSGYAWLVSDRGRLKIVTSANQNTPLEQGLCPVLNLDVWEHAYYLKHYNVRGNYIDDWYHIIDWDAAERNYRNCLQ